MNCKAILSNKTRPEYGQATIPLPIPDSEYDHTIALLGNMGIGSPTAQDCRVDKLDSPYPVLNRLVAQSANVDELDYLAKRLASFCSIETAQFQAMACRLCLSDIKDFINLTFCCQQVTVITDFSNLERIGRNHYINLYGGASTEELENLDGEETAYLLISEGDGVVTPYGVVYDNGMRLEQVYDGRHFPEYFYEDCVASVALSRPGQGGRETLYLTNITGGTWSMRTAGSPPSSGSRPSRSADPWTAAGGAPTPATVSAAGMMAQRNASALRWPGSWSGIGG